MHQISGHAFEIQLETNLERITRDYSTQMPFEMNKKAVPKSNV
jgi:hypothetical protein